MVGKGNFTGVGRTAERRSQRRRRRATSFEIISSLTIGPFEMRHLVIIPSSVITCSSLNYHARAGYRTLFIAKPLGGIYNSQAERHGKIHTEGQELKNKAKASRQKAHLASQCQQHTPLHGSHPADHLYYSLLHPRTTIYLKTEAITSFISSFPPDFPSE